MISDTLSEKRLIEASTAEIFLELYNERYDQKYELVELLDSPDVRCVDSRTGDELDLEISLVEDLPGDARYMLDRGPMPAGPWGTGARGFSQNAPPMMIDRLREKCLKRYGPATALVIQQLSPLWESVDWDQIHEGTLPGATVKPKPKRLDPTIPYKV